jgi:hypothetical protein
MSPADNGPKQVMDLKQNKSPPHYPAIGINDMLY